MIVFFFFIFFNSRSIRCLRNIIHWNLITTFILRNVMWFLLQLIDQNIYETNEVWNTSKLHFSLLICEQISRFRTFTFMTILHDIIFKKSSWRYCMKYILQLSAGMKSSSIFLSAEERIYRTTCFFRQNDCSLHWYKDSNNVIVTRVALLF